MEQPSDRPPEARDQGVRSGESTASTAGSPAEGVPGAGVSRATAFLLLVAAGLAAGAAGGLLSHAVGAPFEVPAELTEGIGMGGPPPDRAPVIAAAQAAAEQQNAALAAAAAGAILAIGLAVTIGLLRKSLRGAVLGGLAGVVLGILFGAAAGYAGLLTNGALLEAGSLDRSHVSIAVHAVVWSIVALGVGAACAAAAGSARSAGIYIPASFAAGLLAGLLYFPLVAVLVPAEDTNIVIPEGLAARILWTTLPGLLMGLTVARASSKRSS